VGGRFEKPNAVVLRRRRWLFLTPVVALMAFVVGLPFLGSGHGALMISLFLGLEFAAIAMLALHVRMPHRLSGTLTADEDALRLGDTTLVHRAEIRNAFVRRIRGELFVRFERSMNRVAVDVRVNDEEEARTLLSTMRLDGARSIGRFMMNRGTLSQNLVVISAGVIAAAAALLFAWSTWNKWAVLGTCIAISVIAILGVLYAMVQIQVGADGVRIRSPLGDVRFIRYDQIADVSTDDTNVTFLLKDGRTFHVHLGAGRAARRFSAPIDDVRRALVARIRERMAAHRGADASRTVASLVRGGRTTEEWLRAVTSSTDDVASFRVPAVPEEVLIAVVGDETAPADARVAAAVALRRTSQSTHAREAVRIAAEACAEPKLRIALESAASDDDAIEESALLESITASHEDAPSGKRAAR
jgi:hypothetical protein